MCERVVCTLLLLCAGKLATNACVIERETVEERES